MRGNYSEVYELINTIGGYWILLHSLLLLFKIHWALGVSSSLDLQPKYWLEWEFFIMRIQMILIWMVAFQNPDNIER